MQLRRIYRWGLALGLAGLVLLVVLFNQRIVSVMRALFPPQSCGEYSALPVDAAAGDWQTGRPMPTAKGEARAVAVDGRIYVIGGLLYQWQASAEVSIYDPAAGAWTVGAPAPIAVNHPGLAVLDGRIYLTGGFNTPDFAYHLQSTYVYAPAEDAWTQVADMPEPRAAHGMAAINGKLYLVGGDGLADPTEVWVYDPALDAWDTSPAHLPSRRDHPATAVLDGKLYVIGGRWRDQGRYSTNEVYDVATDTWTSLAAMPIPRSAATAGVLDGKIHVTGGEDMEIFCTYDEHDVYDPAADSWTRQRNLPTTRHGMASAVINNRWYVMGGGVSAGPYAHRTFTGALEVFVPAH